ASRGSSLVASSLPFWRLPITLPPTTRPLTVSSPSCPRTSRRSDRRRLPSTLSPEDPTPTVICPFESTVSFGAWTMRPAEDTTVTDSTFWKMATRMVSSACARAGVRTGAVRSSARAAVVHARVMLFPEQEPRQETQDDACQDAGRDGEIESEVVTLDQDVAGQLPNRAEAGEASGQDENSPHQHDHHTDPDQDLAEAAYVRINSSAIWMALRAAPFRRLSATIQRLRPLGMDSSSRMRPTNTSSFPATSIGIG